MFRERHDFVDGSWGMGVATAVKFLVFVIGHVGLEAGSRCKRIDCVMKQIPSKLCRTETLATYTVTKRDLAHPSSHLIYITHSDKKVVDRMRPYECSRGFPGSFRIFCRI